MESNLQKLKKISEMSKLLNNHSKLILLNKKYNHQ